MFGREPVADGHRHGSCLGRNSRHDPVVAVERPEHEAAAMRIDHEPMGSARRRVAPELDRAAVDGQRRFPTFDPLRTPDREGSGIVVVEPALLGQGQARCIRRVEPLALLDEGPDVGVDHGITVEASDRCQTTQGGSSMA